MKKQHYIAAFWLVIFGIILLIPNLGFVLSPNEVSDNEKRKKAEFPIVQFDSLTVFTKGLTDYYEDRFWGRDHYIKGTSYLKYHLFNTGSSDKLIVGKDGYLFFNEKDMAEDFRGSVTMKPDSVEWLFEQMLEFRNDFADSVDFIWLTAPNKNSVYPEFLPSRFLQTEFPDRLDQLQEYADESASIMFIDPTNYFKNHKEDSLYYLEDTHWNYNGALLALELISKELESDWMMPLFNTKSDKRVGDLAVLSGIEELEESYQIPVPIHESEFIFNEEYPNVFEHYRNVNAPNDKVVLLMGDSFGLYLRDWLKMMFTELIYVPNWTIRSEVVDLVDPDIVIYEMVERNIPDLYNIFKHP